MYRGQTSLLTWVSVILTGHDRYIYIYGSALRSTKRTCTSAVAADYLAKYIRYTHASPACFAITSFRYYHRSSSGSSSEIYCPMRSIEPEPYTTASFVNVTIVTALIFPSNRYIYSISRHKLLNLYRLYIYNIHIYSLMKVAFPSELYSTRERRGSDRNISYIHTEAIQK